MDLRQKRILSLLAFVAICAVFFFAWVIIGQGDKSEQASANESNVEETNKNDSSNQSVEEAGEQEDFSMSESISLRKNQKDKQLEDNNSESAEQPQTVEETAPTQTIPEEVGLGLFKQLGGTVTVKDGGSLDKNSNITMNGWSPNEPFIINGQQFTEGLGFMIDWGTRSNMSVPSLRIPLNQEYTKLTGKVGIDDQSINAESQYRIDFYAQNLDNTITQLHSTEWLKPGNFAIPFEIDVTNIPMLIIELVKSDDNDEEIRAAIVDTKLE